MKKGISPLIATILLIGMTVGISFFIIMYGSDFVHKTTQRSESSSDEDMICSQNVAFDITHACYLNPTRLRMIISNIGSRDIRSFDARLYESQSNVTKTSISFLVRSSQTATIDIDVPSTFNIRQIELFPTVRHQSRSLTCQIQTDTYGNFLNTDKLYPCT